MARPSRGAVHVFVALILCILIGGEYASAGGRAAVSRTVAVSRVRYACLCDFHARYFIVAVARFR